MIMIMRKTNLIMNFYKFGHLSKNILLEDLFHIDRFIYDIPPDGLRRDVSDILQIPYLSKYVGNKEELKNQRKYEGKIIGNHRRLFFSIPTGLVDSQKYYYVHYLLDTSSPYTTLTHQVLCCLYDKKIDDPNVIFHSLMKTSIGGRVVQILPSNYKHFEDNSTQKYYPNANRLGMNFLLALNGYKQQTNFRDKVASLELISKFN